jgi:pyruvate-formate lyase
VAKKKTTVNPFGSLHAPEDTEVKVRDQGADFQLELAFTAAYRDNLEAHPAVREARCLQVLFPALFEPIRPGDRFAGRIAYRQVGFGLEHASGGPGFYCYPDGLRREMEGAGASPELRAQVEEMIAFWGDEATIDGRLVSILPPDVKAATTNDIANMGGRLAGALLDFAKLVRLGIPGLRADVTAGKDRAQRDGRDTELFDGMLMALNLLVEVCQDYARQARHIAASLGSDEIDRKADLLAMADVLDRITERAPATFREGAQLLWLYALISGVVNYGRMDVALGDLLAQDLDTGLITEDEAMALLRSLWQLIADRKIFFNGRVIVGGRGRPNEAEADRFALLAMEATRTVIETEPQFTLRFYQGQNPALFEKALDVLGEGRTYPMLYNDDVNVPAVANAFDVPLAEAEHYLPYGCGEYALDHLSFGSPNCSLNLLKALEVTLHNGVDPLTGETLGLQTGEFDAFETFEDLFAAYKRQVEHYVAYLARRHALEYEAERASAAFLYVSMLYDDCLTRGRSLVDGGARYLGGVIETFGMVNVADSLAAIKHLVYEQELFSPEELLAVLDADFEGFEVAHRQVLAAPKPSCRRSAVTPPRRRARRPRW